jgi:hypothetical protein
MKTFLIAAAALLYGFALYAEQAAVTLDGKAISVSYTGASLKAGKIPAGQVWKIGAATAPAFHTDADLVFKGAMVPKGDYSLYVLATPDKWQLIISKATGAKASAYDPKMDVGRVNMVMAKAPAPVETVRVTLTKVAAMAAKLEIAGENTAATAQFRLDRAGADSEW